MKRIKLIVVMLLLSALAAQTLHGEFLYSRGSSSSGSAEEAYYHLAPVLPVLDGVLDRMRDLLGLDDEQRMALDAFVLMYDDEALSHWVAAQESLSDLHGRLQDDFTARRVSRSEILSAHRSRVMEVRDRFFADVRLIFTPEQEAMWPRVEREIRRIETLMQHATQPDENFDLIVLAHTFAGDASDDPRLAALAEEYAQEIDPHLLRRNRLIDDAIRAVREAEALEAARHAAMMNPDAGGVFDGQQQIQDIDGVLFGLAKSVEDHSKRIATVNRTFVPRFADLLPEQARMEFLNTVVQTAPPQRIRHRAQGFDNLRASRAAEALTRLTTTGASRLSYYRQSPYVQENTLGSRLPTVEPLTADQMDRLTAIMDAYKSEIIDLLDESARIVAARPRVEFEEDNEEHVEINLGFQQIYISRHDMNKPRQPRRRQPEKEPRIEQLFTRARQIDQRALNDIREILTIRQRAHIANY
ncbi:MAG: hemerythrin domain-containing protein [Phycisphaeraceae bacterium]|nr:MAG: hemerythrin domain-containing protein [Phycisphaeraceae bacterium]